MKTYSFFDESGRFSHCVRGPMGLVIQPSIDAWLGVATEGELDDSYWAYGGMACKRRPCPAALDGLTLRGVRPGSTIHINGFRYECEDGGEVELEFDQPGLYRVRIARWPYLDGEYEVENPA